MTALIRRVTIDGRLYPPSWPHMPDAERQRLRAIEHSLHCHGGLSIRQTQAAMLSQYGERRSVGQIHADLTRFQCPYCAPKPPAPPAPPDPRNKPQVFAWR